MNKEFLAVFGLIALLASAPAIAQKTAAGATAGDKQASQNRMVFQVNEDDSRKWHTVLANLNNVQEELGKVDISVVAIGPGLGMLKADALTANGVQDAMAAGVRDSRTAWFTTRSRSTSSELVASSSSRIFGRL